ncbi:hypothetical protein H1C71_021413 [Ictidomys tridecemlineatus]|nr:hypothetical protein H1C71_021413 [Ictidomys tridecemlineatus]KAG3268413.1 hypothetical protein H1C71_021413 [Ictidomys tridecemlineatus]
MAGSFGIPWVLPCLEIFPVYGGHFVKLRDFERLSSHLITQVYLLYAFDTYDTTNFSSSDISKLVYPSPPPFIHVETKPPKTLSSDDRAQLTYAPQPTMPLSLRAHVLRSLPGVRDAMLTPGAESQALAFRLPFFFKRGKAWPSPLVAKRPFY